MMVTWIPLLRKVTLKSLGLTRSNLEVSLHNLSFLNMTMMLRPQPPLWWTSLPPQTMAASLALLINM